VGGARGVDEGEEEEEEEEDDDDEEEEEEGGTSEAAAAATLPPPPAAAAEASLLPRDSFHGAVTPRDPSIAAATSGSANKRATPSNTRAGTATTALSPLNPTLSPW